MLCIWDRGINEYYWWYVHGGCFLETMFMEIGYILFGLVYFWCDWRFCPIWYHHLHRNHSIINQFLVFWLDMGLSLRSTFLKLGRVTTDDIYRCVGFKFYDVGAVGKNFSGKRSWQSLANWSLLWSQGPFRIHHVQFQCQCIVLTRW